MSHPTNAQDPTATAIGGEPPALHFRYDLSAIARSRRNRTPSRRSTRSFVRSTRQKNTTQRRKIARAIVLWDWDGIIPDCKRQSIPVKDGDRVDICHVVDATWYEIYVDRVFAYIPRNYVQVEAVYKEKYQSQFQAADGKQPVVIGRVPPVPPLQPQNNQEPHTLKSSKPKRPPVPQPPSELRVDTSVNNDQHKEVVPEVVVAPQAQKGSWLGQLFNPVLNLFKAKKNTAPTNPQEAEPSPLESVDSSQAHCPAS